MIYPNKTGIWGHAPLTLQSDHSSWDLMGTLLGAMIEIRRLKGELNSPDFRDIVMRTSSPI